MDTEFYARLRALAAEYDMLPSEGLVLCAVSGGIDSMALLHALCALRAHYGFSVAAAHFNHHLRAEASEHDADFVRAHCAHIDLPCYLGEGNVRVEAAARGTGIEETARAMRYAFLEETAAQTKAVRIATAHHADDNLETLLLHLTRGTGLRGLCGIPPRRGTIIRPFLELSRAEIEAYLQRNHIPFAEDETNADTGFSRNRLRHELIPVLRSLNPNLTRATATAMRSLREDEAYLEAQAAALFHCANRAEDGMVLPVDVLCRAPRAVAIRTLQRILEEIEAPPASAVHLRGILAIAAGDNPAAALHLPGGVLVHRVYGDLLLAWDRDHEPLPPLEPLPLARNAVVQAGDWQVSCREVLCPTDAVQTATHCYLRAEGLDALTLRARTVGDFLALPGRRNKTLKKLLIEEKIPRRERERLPVLVCGERVLAVAGLGAARDALASPGVAALELHFIKGN